MTARAADLSAAPVTVRQIGIYEPLHLQPYGILIEAQRGYVGHDAGRGSWLSVVDVTDPRAITRLGRTKTVKKSTGVEGAAEVEVQTFVGLAFARNIQGLRAFDLATGKEAFRERHRGRPWVMNGKFVVTLDNCRRAYFRDANDGYKVKGRLDLGPFDLVPTNPYDGAVYGCTSDGVIVAAIPK